MLGSLIWLDFFPADTEEKKISEMICAVLLAGIFSTSRQLKQTGWLVQTLSGSAFNMQKEIFCHCVWQFWCINEHVWSTFLIFIEVMIHYSLAWRQVALVPSEEKHYYELSPSIMRDQERMRDGA